MKYAIPLFVILAIVLVLVIVLVVKKKESWSDDYFNCVKFSPEQDPAETCCQKIYGRKCADV